MLCVAEKPSIAKAVANHLGGQAHAVSLDTILTGEENRQDVSLMVGRNLFAASNGSRTTNLTSASIPGAIAR